MSKKKIFIGLGLVIVLALIITGQVMKKRNSKSTMVKTTQSAREEIIEKVTAPARVQPVTIVNISADVMGQITELAVEEGDWVEKGQFLMQIDPSIYQSAVDRTDALVKSAIANEELAAANLRQAHLDLNRKNNLFEKNLVSEADIDLAKTQVEINEAQLRSSKEQVQQAKASLSEAKSNLKKTRLVSPMSGTVSQLNVEEGETAVTGTMNNPGTVLLSIADLTRMKTEAEVDETDVVHLEIGQKVEIEVDALPDTILIGEVREIANTATVQGRGTDQEITNFTVKAEIIDNHPKLRPGMSATIAIIANTREDALAVPIQAIVMRRPSELEPKDEKADTEKTETEKYSDEDKAMSGIFVIVDDPDAKGKDGKMAHFKKVETGISSDTSIEILAGLEVDEEVITGPYKTLLDLDHGQAVEIEKEDEKKPAFGEN